MISQLFINFIGLLAKLNNLFFIFISVLLIAAFVNRKAFKKRQALTFLVTCFVTFVAWRLVYGILYGSGSSSRYFGLLPIVGTVFAGAGLSLISALIIKYLFRRPLTRRLISYINITFIVAIVISFSIVALHNRSNKTFIPETANIIDAAADEDKIIFVDVSGELRRIREMLLNSKNIELVQLPKYPKSAENIFWRKFIQEFPRLLNSKRPLYLLVRMKEDGRFLHKFSKIFSWIPWKIVKSWKFRERVYRLLLLDKSRCPENWNLNLASNLYVAPGETYRLKFSSFLPATFNDDYRVEVNCRYGKLSNDAWIYTPALKDPKQFDLEITVWQRLNWPVAYAKITVERGTGKWETEKRRMGETAKGRVGETERGRDGELEHREKRYTGYGVRSTGKEKGELENRGNGATAQVGKCTIDNPQYSIFNEDQCFISNKKPTIVGQDIPQPQNLVMLEPVLPKVVITLPEIVLKIIPDNSVPAWPYSLLEFSTAYQGGNQQVLVSSGLKNQPEKFHAEMAIVQVEPIKFKQVKSINIVALGDRGQYRVSLLHEVIKILKRYNVKARFVSGNIKSPVAFEATYLSYSSMFKKKSPANWKYRNPFINNNDEFDFTNYLKIRQINKVDFILFLNGWNEIFNHSFRDSFKTIDFSLVTASVKRVVNHIRHDSPETHIALSLPATVAMQDNCSSLSPFSRYWSADYLRLAKFNYIRDFIKEFSDTKLEELYLLPLCLAVDQETGFKNHAIDQPHGAFDFNKVSMRSQAQFIAAWIMFCLQSDKLRN
jgi:hypothetical protein